VELVVYPPRKTPFEIVSEFLSGSSAQASAGRWLASTLSRAELDLLRAARGPFSRARRGEALALMPFRFVR
jgi:hypothetical protein